jgi:plastocyanin
MATRPLSRASKWCAAAAMSGALVFGGVAAATSAASAAAPAAKKPAVKIINYSYMPKSITVKAGTTIIWTNNDNTGHTVTFKAFGSPVLGQGKTWSHSFTAAGTFKYHCTLHPEMTGKVIVTS